MSSTVQRNILLDKYYSLSVDSTGFDILALEIFDYQYKNNLVYQRYLKILGFNVENIQNIKEIPALPIQVYKHHDVKSFETQPVVTFESSGTTDKLRSKHLVLDEGLYRHSCKTIFEDSFGPVEDYCFLALLPSYLENQNSSLVYMLDYFISKSKYSESGFYLYDFEKLYTSLEKCEDEDIPVILFGVSFALLDFIQNRNINFPKLIIIETGGMKGRKKEMLKADIINSLRETTSSDHVLSEYGMTELFSQFYAQDGIHFESCRYAKVDIMQLNDPFTIQKNGKPGILRITDLSNIDSCSFILTEDIAIKHDDGTFQILGRADHSELRGCNLLYAG